MEKISVILYSEINLFCVFILLIILYKLIFNIDKRLTGRIFISIVTSVIFFLMLDLMWGLIESGFINVSSSTNSLVNIIYFIFSGLSSYLWFIYSEMVQKSWFVKSKYNIILSSVPFIILALMSIASYKTGWFFYIDNMGHYQRGSLYAVQLILSYGYIILTSTKALYLAQKKENHLERQEYLALFSFAVFPLIFGYFQIFLQGIPMLCMGITAAVFIAYINIQELKISLDPLTKINNRQQMTNYLSGQMKKASSNTMLLYLLILDLDHFKAINDKYGHTEGDIALVRVADVLKKVSSQFNCMISRYGGDEFVIIYEDINNFGIENFCNLIHTSLSQENSNANSPYKLNISIGYARYSDEIKSIPEFIAIADKELFKVKNSRI